MEALRRQPHIGHLAAIGDIRALLEVIGILLIVLALFMAPPMVADLVSNDSDWEVFLISGCVTLFVGVALKLMNRSQRSTGELTARQAFLLTTAVWVVTTLFAALPLAFSDLGLSVGEAVFEAMSGLTTTGSTVIIGLDYASPGILLWRAILQWLGGIGIIVMGVAILPLLSVGGMQLFRTESSDLSDKILPRAAQLASAIGMIYLVLTIICGVLYWLAGMNLFNAAAHAMTTIATGGFSTSDQSMGIFQSGQIEWVATVFMIVGAIPFVLYIQAVNGAPLALWRDSQVRWFVGILGLAWLLIALWLMHEHGTGPIDAIRLAAFNVTSVITGTGYASVDYGVWGTFPVALLFFLMCVGGCTGSTTGGIKVFRFTVLYAVSRAQAFRLLQPHGVFVPLYNGRPLPEAAAMSVLAFFSMFAFTFAILALILSAMGLDYLTAMSSALTSLANVGPGLGEMIGPSGSFHSLPEGAKWLLSGAMLLGRLELFTVLILFSPAFWRA